MKKIKILVPVLSFFACILLPVCNLQAQEQTLSEMKMPEIPYQPSVKKGWVGQFVYAFNFNDSTGTGKGKTRVYYHTIVNNISSGYVELTMEVRGAIRANQPDKNNGQRYESWINSGTKNSWSKVNQTDTSVVPTGVHVSNAITGRLEKFSHFTSSDNWVKGWIANTDLQIDYTTGKYIFGLPLVSYELEGDETMIETTFNPEKKNERTNKAKRTHGFGGNYLTYGEWNIQAGSFKEGQKEIIIRERIPVSLEQSHNDKKLPVKKGFIDFYLVLKKVG